MDNTQLAPALRDGTFTVEFFHAPNNLTISVDVVSTDKDQAVIFARERFKLDDSWDLVGTDKKYTWPGESVAP